MQPARSVKLFINYLKANGIYRILDYGAGTLRNSIYLANQGFFVLATDRRPPPRDVYGNKKIWWVAKDVIAARILKNFDLVICNFVLNIVEGLENRENLIREIIELLKPGGFLMLETREKRMAADQNTKHALSREELDYLVLKHGLTPIMFMRGRISLAVLYKKMSNKREG